MVSTPAESPRKLPASSALSSQVGEALEWHTFLDLAASLAHSEPACALIQQWVDPMTWAMDRESARARLAETQLIQPLRAEAGLWSVLSGRADPEHLTGRLGKGATLTLAELVELRGWFEALRAWRVFGSNNEAHYPQFNPIWRSLSDSEREIEILRSILTPEGQLSEYASETLGALYREIRGLKRQIERILGELIRSYGAEGILQDQIQDQRDGRYVLPVKAAHQHQIDGLIFESSASGQTVFMEPTPVRNLAQKLRQAETQLQREIHLILEKTSRALSPRAAELMESFDVLISWDTIQARASLADRYQGQPIELSENHHFELFGTSHPLLWGAIPSDQIVRNDLIFGEPARCLLFTGPNTGGKTVLLKTLGLAGICARTGFYFPASRTSCVPFFDAFFCDVGDPQSLREHLSSFSGHVARFKEILERMTPGSLVLIDELNSATDPEEGAAFGRAILETIIQRGAMVVTTTHDPHLKALALSDPRIENAGLIFDETTLSPTFRVQMGIPGRSRALDTALRLGIAPAIIERARSYLSRGQIDLGDMLGRLEEDRQSTLRAREEAEQLLIQLRQEKAELEIAQSEWQKKSQTEVQSLIEATRQKLRRTLEEAQSEVRLSVKKLGQQQSRREMDQTRTKLNERVRQALQSLSPAEGSTPVTTPGAPRSRTRVGRRSSVLAGQTLQVGSQVRLLKWKSTATILEIQGARLKVAVGTIQMNVTLNDVELLNSSVGVQPSHSRPLIPTPTPAPANTALPSVLELRGKRFEEAMNEATHYLDQIYQQGELPEVTLIHGVGSGALRTGCHDLLRTIPYVQSFQDGGPGLGGAGATRVIFRN